MKKLFLLTAFLLNASSYLSAQFQNLGNEDYGRIFNLTYDPTIENKVYALSQGNHLLVSTNNGVNWDVLYAHPHGELEQLKFISEENSLSFVSKNSNFATDNSEFTYGLFVYNLTTNQISKSFQLPTQENSTRESIKAYAIWEANPDVALVVQDYILPPNFRYSKVFYTTNGGENWSEVYYSNDNLDYFPENVAISPHNAEKLFIARGLSFDISAGGLLISEDAGLTWTEKLAGICLSPISFHPENPNEIWIGSGIGYGNDHSQGLFKSVDGGENWNLISLPWTPYIADNIRVIEFNPSNLNQILVLEENEIALSLNGGNSWEIVTHPEADMSVEGYYDGRSLSFNPYNANELFLNTAFYPLFSSDSGNNFQRVKTPFFKESGNLHYFHQNGVEHLYYGVQNGFMHLNFQNFEETGYGIVPLNSFSFSPNVMVHIDETTEGRIFSFHPPFHLKLSTAHGENSSIIFSPNNKNECNFVAVDPQNPNLLYASFSFNGEMTEIHKIDITNLDSPVITQLNSPQTNGKMMNILIDPVQSNQILVSQGRSVFKSSNGGESWTNYNLGLEDILTDNDVVFKLKQNLTQPNVWVLATSNGIFRSVDYAESWTQIQTSFTSHIIYQDEFILATTSNQDGTNISLIYSQNNGATWGEIDFHEFHPIHLSQVISSTDFHIQDQLVSVFMGTSGLGVIKFSLDLTTLTVIDAEFFNSNSILLYPNPTSDFLNIHSKEEVQSVEIVNLSGQRVLSNSTSKINISPLNTGTYIVQILFKNGSKASKKFLKK